MEDYDLYVGIPTKHFGALRDSVARVVAESFPDSGLPELMDGYWSGINEETLHFIVRSDTKQIESVLHKLHALSSELFIACCETETY